jgi:hypothetical protein
MKKFLLLLGFLPFFLISCDDSEDTEETTENIGSVQGVWGYSTASPLTASVNLSGNQAIAIAAKAALTPVLQQYAMNNEPDAYFFKEANNDSTFVAYMIDTETGDPIEIGEGNHSIKGNTLVLNYTDPVKTETFDIITANQTTLKLRKNYMTDLTKWAADILGGFAGVEIESAYITITYDISN